MDELLASLDGQIIIFSKLSVHYSIHYMSAIFRMLFEGFPLDYIARFCRYAILAFVGIFCIPWLFVFIERKLSLELGAPTE